MKKKFPVKNSCAKIAKWSLFYKSGRTKHICALGTQSKNLPLCSSMRKGGR